MALSLCVIISCSQVFSLSLIFSTDVFFEFNLSGFPRFLKSENLWHSSNFWPFFFPRFFFWPNLFPLYSETPVAHMLHPLRWSHKFLQVFSQSFSVVQIWWFLVFCFLFLFFLSRSLTFFLIICFAVYPTEQFFFLSGIFFIWEITSSFHSFCLFCKNCTFPFISSVFSFTFWSLATLSS